MRAAEANTFDQRAKAPDLPGAVLYILIPVGLADRGGAVRRGLWRSGVGRRRSRQPAEPSGFCPAAIVKGLDGHSLPEVAVYPARRFNSSPSFALDPARGHLAQGVPAPYLHEGAATPTSRDALSDREGGSRWRESSC